jgi:hypothetical protein
VLGSSKEVWEALGLMPRKVRGPNNFLENHLWSFKKRGGRNSSWRAQKNGQNEERRGINEKN